MEVAANSSSDGGASVEHSQELHDRLPHKPIVSDMTVSSKDSKDADCDSKSKTGDHSTIESRDDNGSHPHPVQHVHHATTTTSSNREGAGDDDRESLESTKSATKPSKGGAPPVSNSNGTRYHPQQQQLYPPPTNNNNGMNGGGGGVGMSMVMGQQQHHQQQQQRSNNGGPSNFAMGRPNNNNVNNGPGPYGGGPPPPNNYGYPIQQQQHGAGAGSAYPHPGGPPQGHHGGGVGGGPPPHMAAQYNNNNNQYPGGHHPQQQQYPPHQGGGGGGGQHHPNNHPHHFGGMMGTGGPPHGPYGNGGGGVVGPNGYGNNNNGYGPPRNGPGGNYPPPPVPHHHNMYPPHHPAHGGGGGPGNGMGPGGPYPMNQPYGNGGGGGGGMPPSYPNNSSNHGAGILNTSTDSTTSISSARSKSSRNSSNTATGGNKKRTIHDGVQQQQHNLPSAYSFRRTDSNSSSTASTVVTAGNNTSHETATTSGTTVTGGAGESPKKRRGGNSSNHTNNQAVETKTGSSSARQQEQEEKANKTSSTSNKAGATAAATAGAAAGGDKRRYHRRDYSAASTASSLSVGGFSLSSYEGPRVGAIEDAMVTDEPLLTSSPKRHKTSSSKLMVDTEMRPESAASIHSAEADHQSTTKFEQLSIDAASNKLLPPSTSSESSAGRDRNLFLTLSTSPINNDVDQTPISKNTHKQSAANNTNNAAGTTTTNKAEGANAAATAANSNKASIFKPKGTTAKAQPKIEASASDASRPSDTPTPPVHRELATSMTDEHSMLNQHMRNQSFTPLPHLNATGNECSVGSNNNHSPSAAAFAAAIAPQLSWSIAGDTPSLGDLADWDHEEDHPNAGGRSSRGSNNNKSTTSQTKTDLKIRPSSTASSSTGTRNMTISPHEFSFWKEEHEMDMIVTTSCAGTAGNTTILNGGTTTPLPAFFESNESAENNHHGMMHHRFDHSSKKEDHPMHPPQHHPHQHPAHGGPPHHHHPMHPMFGNRNNGPPTGLKPLNKPMPPHPIWSKHHDPNADKMAMGMPPTPMFSGSDFRDDGFGPRSPMGCDRRDGGPMEFYPYMHPPPPGPNDRVRNLRGRIPPHMAPMPLHIPPPMSAHHLPMTSPMGLGPKAGLWSPHHMPHLHPPLASPHHMGSPLGSMAQSKRKCVPLKPPIPSKFQGDIDKAKSAPVPEFTSLVNFPGHMSQKQSVNLPEGMRCCVMCGQACPCSTGNKCKKSKCKNSDGSLAPRSSNAPDHPGQQQQHHPHMHHMGGPPQQQQCQQLGDKNSGYAIIPTQNKGLCTLCDVNVWVVVTNGLEIKWCKGCKNFRPWAAFGDKGLATKCLRCRERQREKYALQKEEKEKSRLTTKTKAK